MTELHERESQLASAHEQLLLAEADRETLATAVRAYMAANSYSDRGRRLGQLKDLLRAEHPGQALADELKAARAEIEVGRLLADAVTAYFNKRGAAHATHAGNGDVAAMAEALAAYGMAEQKARAK